MNHNKFKNINKLFFNIYIILLFIIASIISSCSYSSQNTGYEINEKINDMTNEEIFSILKNSKVPTEPAYLGSVRIPNLSEINIEKTSYTEVYSGDVETYIEKLRDKNVEYYYDYKKFVSYGDMLNIDFVGFVDNIPYPELSTNPEDGGVMLAIGSNSFIKGFENQLIAKRTRRTYPVTVTLPDDYPNPLLAGKVANFNVTINRIYNARTPETDENFYYKFSPSKSTYSFIFREEVSKILTDERNFIVNMEYQSKIKEALLEQSLFVPSTEAIAWQFANVIHNDLETANKFEISFEDLISNSGYNIKEYYKSAVNKAINNLKPIMINRKLKQIYSDIKINNTIKNNWFENFKKFASLHEKSTIEQLIRLYGEKSIENEIFDYLIYQRLQSEVNIYEPSADLTSMYEEQEEVEEVISEEESLENIDNSALAHES